MACIYYTLQKEKALLCRRINKKCLIFGRNGCIIESALRKGKKTMVESENSFGRVSISLDEGFTLNSADNKNKYDTFYDTGDFGHDFCKIISINIKNREEKNIALVCGYLTYEECFILKDNFLIFMSENVIFKIDIVTYELVLKKKIPIFESTFGIYEYNGDYIIYGEIDIARTDKCFDLLWSFAGADIFVTLDNSCPFEMKDDRIILRDFIGDYYEIDYNGKPLGGKDNHK